MAFCLGCYFWGWGGHAVGEGVITEALCMSLSQPWVCSHWLSYRRLSPFSLFFWSESKGRGWLHGGAVIQRQCWLGREPSKTGLSKTMLRDKGSTGHTLVNTACHGKLGSRDWQFLDIFSNCLLCSLTNTSLQFFLHWPHLPPLWKRTFCFLLPWARHLRFHAEARSCGICLFEYNLLIVFQVLHAVTNDKISFFCKAK